MQRGEQGHLAKWGKKLGATTQVPHSPKAQQNPPIFEDNPVVNLMASQTSEAASMHEIHSQ